MYSRCQRASMLKGSLPIKALAHCSRVSFAPPSPMPVMPASVSTVTSMLLWLKSGLRSGGFQMRTRVIFAFGREAAASLGSARHAAGTAASDFRNDLRCMEESFLTDERKNFRLRVRRLTRVGKRQPAKARMCTGLAKALHSEETGCMVPHHPARGMGSWVRNLGIQNHRGTGDPMNQPTQLEAHVQR